MRWPRVSAVSYGRRVPSFLDRAAAGTSGSVMVSTGWNLKELREH